MKPPFYEFEWPVKIVAGDRALEHLAAEVHRLGMKRILLLSDEGLERAGWVRLVRAQIPQDLFISEFARVPPDSDAALLTSLFARATEERIDGLISLGGGSVLDSGKALSLMLARGSSDLRAVENFEIYTDRVLSHIAIPTTSGTGSESSHSAVIKDGSHKRLIAGRALYPHTALLDPRIMQKMPMRLAIATGLDAWTHAWESLTSLQSNPISQAIARAALKSLARELPRLATHPSDLGLRLALAESASLAGIAFTHSMLGMAHALGHTLASLVPIHHGEAVTLFFPHSLSPLLSRCPQLFEDVLEDCPFSELRTGGTPSNVAALWTYLMEFRKRLAEPVGIALSLKSVGLERGRLPELARGALLDGPSLFSPYAWSEADLLRFLEHTYERDVWSLEETAAWTR
jgi:alcohol dehydrogenase